MSSTGTVASAGVRGKLATLLFLIALLLGNGALIGGLENEAGMFSAGVFAVVCVLWWISYRMSRSANSGGITLGFVALGLWILALAGALAIDFHHFIVDHFFWASAGILFVLIAAITLSNTPCESPKA
jgi:hypothetical protein